MAGTLMTDLKAVATALVVPTDQQGPGGLPVGVDPVILVDTAINGVRDMLRIANEINRVLPVGAAKTAMAVVLTDLT